MTNNFHPSSFILHPFLLACLMMPATGLHAAPPPSEAELLEILKSNAPVEKKCAACRELKTAGTEKSIPALAALLTDEAISHCARIALESMPYPAADIALRNAAEKATGLAKAGIFDSLGNRRDEDAVPLLAAALKDKDPAVVSAAATALSRITTDDAAKALRAAYREAGGDARRKINEGMLRYADRILHSGRQNAAAPVYRDLLRRGGPRAVQMAALCRVFRISGPGSPQIITDALSWKAPPTASSALRILWSNSGGGIFCGDPQMAQAAAGELPDLPAADLKAIGAGLSRLPVAGQVAVLTAIRLRGDRSLAPLVTGSLKSDNVTVRVAAIRALGILGDAAAVPVLGQWLGGQGPETDAARFGLELLRAAGVDDRIVAAMREEKDATRRALWIAMLQTRRSGASVPALLEEARQGPARDAAVTALAQLASPKDVAALTAIALKTPKGRQRDDVERAVMLVCRQIPDAAMQAQPVIEVLKNAGPADRVALLPMLGRLGGTKALELVEAALQSSEADLNDAGVRALCNWPDASVVERLWRLAQQDQDAGHRTSALRAAVRLVTLPGGVSDAQKLAKLKEAMQMASRAEDRLLIIDRAAAVRCVESLRFVAPYLDDEALAQQACKTVAELAHHRELYDPNKAQFNPALEKVLKIARDPAVLELARRSLGGG